jgi:hypothetical protein
MVLWVVGSRRDFEEFLRGLNGGKVRGLPQVSVGSLPSGELCSPEKKEGDD